MIYSVIITSLGMNIALTICLWNIYRLIRDYYYKDHYLKSACLHSFQIGMIICIYLTLMVIINY